MPPLENTLDHFIVSFIASILGILIGGVIVFGFSHVIQKVSNQSPKIQRYILFIPWRTFIVGTLEFFLNPIPIVYLFPDQFGIGRDYAIISTSGLLACLVILFTPVSVFIKEPVQPLWFFLPRVLRSIMTVSVAMTTSAGTNATAGLGFYIVSRLNNYDILAAMSGWLITILICLAIDLITGLLQFVFWKPYSIELSNSIS